MKASNCIEIFDSDSDAESKTRPCGVRPLPRSWLGPRRGLLSLTSEGIFKIWSFHLKNNCLPKHVFIFANFEESSKLRKVLRLHLDSVAAASPWQVLSSKNPIYSMKRKLCKHKTKNNRCTAKIHIDKWDHHGFTMNHPVNNVSGAPLLTGCPGLACWTATSWRWPYH